MFRPSPDLPELYTRLERLKRIRAAGTLTVEQADNGGRITYRSDAELVAAIASVEKDINRIEGKPSRRIRSFRVHTHKGW